MKEKDILNKIINKKVITISAIILIFAIISGISIKQYNTSNVKTNLGEAQQSNYPFTGAELVKKAVTFINQPKDCSGLVNAAITSCGGTGIKNGDTAGWNQHYFRYNFSGTTFEPKEIGSYTSSNGTKTKWYKKIANVDTLPIGTVISGHGDASMYGHVFIYIGKANDYNTLKNNLKKQYNIDLPEYNSAYVDQRDVNGLQGAPYWYIEGNATTNKVKIRNFSWYVNNDNDVKNMKYIRVWKITENPSGSYHMNIVKKDSKDDKDKSLDEKYKYALDGAEFSIQQQINATGNKNVGYTSGQDSKVVTKSGDKSLIYFKNTTDKNGNIKIENIGKYDSYIIKESKAPLGYKLDKNWTLELRVYKSLYYDGNEAKYGISKIQVMGNGLNANGKEISLSNNTESKWLRINSSGSYTEDSVNYKVAFEFNRSAITVTWKNPENTVDVPVEIEKTNEQGNYVDGAEFYYWVYDTLDNKPYNSGMENVGFREETSSGKCSLTIKGMKYGTKRYVWIRENSTIPYCNLGYFEGESEGTFKYIVLEVSVDDKGNISISRVYDDFQGNETYLVQMSKTSGNTVTGLMENNEGLKTNYVKTGKIKYDQGKIIIPVINPSNEYSFEMLIGKKSTNSEKTLSEKDLIKGANFNIRSAKQDPSYFVSDKDALDGKTIEGYEFNPDNKSKLVTSENGKYVSLSEKDLIPEVVENVAGMVHIYEIEEKSAPDGYKLNNVNKFYVKVTFENREESNLGKIRSVEFYKNLNEKGMLSKENEIEMTNEKIESGDLVYYPTDTNYNFYCAFSKDHGVMTLLIDNPPIEGSYNIGLAKVKKEYLDNFGELDIRDNLDNTTTKAGAIFNIEQQKSEGVNGTDKKENFTTTGNGIDNVYENVQIENLDKQDIYDITETGAPSGFDIYKHKVRIFVTKATNNAQIDKTYVIDSVKVGVDLNDNGTFEDEEITTVEKENRNREFKKINDNVYVLYSELNLLFVLGDDSIDGSYKMDIVKKELKDDKEDSDNYISTLSGAKFEVKQILNDNEDNSQTAKAIPDENGITSEKDQISSITNKVEITDINKVDTYTIKEISTIPGFNLDNVNFTMKVHKGKSEESHKYTIEYLTLIKAQNEESESVNEINVHAGEKLYISNDKTSFEYFADYIVAVELVENSVGDYSIKFTWRDKQPTYNLNLLKTDSNTGNNIESPVTATFTIKAYTDETFATEATFVNKDGENLNKEYTTSVEADDYGNIRIQNIVMPEVQNDPITNYIAITEESISDADYNIFDGTIIIPITFTRQADGKITYSFGEKYVIDNITNKEKLEDRINSNASSDDSKVSFSNDQNTINVTVPNSRSGVFSIRLYKQYTTKYGNSKVLDGVQFTIKVTKEGETDPLYESTEENPDITGKGEDAGRIQIDNLKIKEGDRLKINIRELQTLDGYEIPDDLKNGIEYSATAIKTKDFLGNDIIGIKLGDETYSSVQAKVYSNRRIEMLVNNEKTPEPGKYKINLAKTGEGGLVLDGISFNRTVTLNQNNVIKDDYHNIKPNITEKQTTNDRGVICVTEGIEKDNDNFVTVPVENYSSSPDVYELTETELGDKESSYVKLNKTITLKVGKGEEEYTNKAHATSITMHVGEKNLYINLKTNKYKVWSGDENNSINATEYDYEPGTEQVVEISADGFIYKITLRGTYDTETNEAFYYIGVVNPRQPISSKYKVNIKKIGTDGTALDGVVFGRTAKLNVDQTTGTAGKTVETDMDATSNGGYASVTKDVETTGSDLITVSKDNYEKTDTYKINEKSLGANEGKYSKYPYDIDLVVEKAYKNYKASASKAKLTINNETKEIDLSNSKTIEEQKITVKDSNNEDIDVVMNASIKNNEVTITLTIEDSELISVPVEKRWVDNNDENKVRPSSVKVELKYKKGGNWVKYEKDGVENPVTLTEANNWKHTWDKLPKNINGNTAEYTVEESVVPYGYTVNKTTENGVIILTNTHVVTEVVAKSKQWENVTNPNLYRVDMELYKKGETTKIGDTKSVIGNDMATWKNQEKYDENHKEIEYEVREVKAYYRTSETSLWNELEEGKDYVADEENDVFINTVITPGKYKIMLSKIDKDTQKAISGVTFRVNDVTTDPTGSNGFTYVKDKDGNQLEVNIDKDNFNVTDTYEITEINLNNKANDYYKIKDTLKVNVTKTRLTDNNQITYKLDSVSFEGGTVGSDGIARKEVTLENDEKAEVTAEIIGSNIKITVPNKEKNGKYSLKLIKYKKGTQTAVAGAKFHLIGGNIGNGQLGRGTENLSETNYSEIITATTPVSIWNDTIAIKDVAIADTYTLKEVDVGADNTDMFLGFTEQIKITVNKNSDYNVESVGLTVGGKEATEKNGKLVFSKSIHNQAVKATLSLDKSTNTITLEVENPEKYGSFDFNLVKYIKGTETPLDGAGFKISILNKGTNEFVKDGEGNAIDGTKEIFVEEGKILIENINIAKAGITYEIKIEETTIPEGYLGLDGPITFTAVSELNADGETYSLKTNKSTTIANAKLVDVKEDEILVEAENRVEPTIHKGVKDVKNQSSGYYYNIVKDKYENVEDAKQSLHDWVIEVSLPQGVDEYSIYEISDTIDERLVYDSIASVKIKDGEDSVADLVEGTDYKVNYDEGTRLLKITFIGQNQALSETIKQNIGKLIEVKFYTKYALDANGNIIALNQSVPNQATLTYGNGSTIESEKPEVHTGGVGLYKYDKDTGKALAGAHFKIATSKENAENKVFLKDTEGNDVEVVSGEDGKAEFTGLEFGEDALNKVEYKVIDEITNAEVYKYDWDKVQTTYYIVETESPEGYMPLEEPIEAIVKKDNYNMEDITTLIQVGNQSNQFDLALRKWVSQAIVIEDGKTVVTETGHKAEDDPEEVVKVDLRRSKIEDITVKFRYKIRVTNEGKIAGEAKEIRDDVPDGLKFVQEDNPDWRIENGDLLTDKLAGTTLQPGESAEVEILLTWVNSLDNMGTKINTAEIQEDHNAYGVPDIDSTPGNNVPGEDDIDDAPVMLTVKTGTDYILYASIGLVAIAIIITGGVAIKKKVMKRI